MKNSKYHNFIFRILSLNIIFILGALNISSCKKDWLNTKPYNNIVVPTSISDFQSLLDNYTVFNTNQPAVGEASSDDYFYTQTGYNSVNATQQAVYDWQKLIPYYGIYFQSWDAPYQAVLYANIALEGINKIVPTRANLADWNNVKGSALFYRSTEFFNLSQIFALPYNSNTAAIDLGIPLKLSSDVNEKIGRGTVQQTYNEIILELKQSLQYLPDLPLSNNKERPSKCSAYGMLTRVFLSMNDYKNAFLYADSCLKINSSLINFNTLDTSANDPIPYPNPEIIYDMWLDNEYYPINISGYLDSNLYKSYNDNDLRKYVFFSNSDGTGNQFRGNYTPTRYVLQGGITVDEMLLTRAECYARNGDSKSAMNDLNVLLSNRWKTNTFQPFSAISSSDALNQILIERRKELVFRGTRWLDLRRLNIDPDHAVTLTRNINGQIYSLPPNDPRYVFVIPAEELLYNPIPQNQR